MKPLLGNREQPEFPFARSVPFGQEFVEASFGGKGQVEPERPIDEEKPMYPFARGYQFSDPDHVSVTKQVSDTLPGYQPTLTQIIRD